jgi:sodium-dependent dicarboxylate transporter 2/3/5
MRGLERIERIPIRVAAKKSLNGAWRNRAWLDVLPRPVLVDCNGLVEQVNPPGYNMSGANTETIVDSVNFHKNPEAFEARLESGGPAESAKGLESSEDVARRAMIMVAILVVAALLWGTEGLPIAGTVTLVAVMMLTFGILSPNELAKAFMNDAVLFILGILAVAVGVSKTGLDKRIGLLLLSRIKSAGAFAFVFFPVLAISSAFLSAHALVALLVPVIMGVYKATCNAHGIKHDRALAILLLLGISFAANIGGPGSPAAGARNAIMIGYLADAGFPIGFGEWMKYGMPLVPVLALTVGAYMYVRCKPKLLVERVNPSEVVKREVLELPRFGGKEAAMALILVALVLAWMTLQGSLGMGGATLAAVCAMFFFRIASWDDIQRGVAFDVVGLYGAASAIAVGLSFTGGGLWLATRTVDLMPGILSEGSGLIMGVSILTATLTNFMSDGATVGTLGPLALPMAELADVSIWKMGLMVSFASSFANVLVVGTPNNAIVFAMSKDPETGKRLLSVFDFIKYGLPLTILLMVVLWGWALFGYWNVLSWP